VQTLVLVRHGATPWNENGYCQGRRDVALSDVGRAQAERLREALASVRFDRTFASPLARARETARLLGQEPEILYELIEIDRGHWEGHDAAEIQRRWGKLHRAWYDDPRGLGMPGGESFEEVWERAGLVLKRVQDCGAQTILACGHKALNRVLIARALDRPSKGVWAIPQPQACRTVLVRTNARWSAETIGDVSHLPPPLIAGS
jgi:broad specificity phosphatase PhoE